MSRNGYGGRVADLRVPLPNNFQNKLINQLIGNRNDVNSAETIFGFLQDMWEELHSSQLVYPSLAQGVLITSHSNAYTLGNFIEVIPVNTITNEFHIHHLHLLSPNANGDYEIRLYQGTTLIGEATFSRTDKKDDVEGLEIYTSHCEANAQIQARLSSSNAAQQDTVRLKVWYHLHLHS